MHGSVINTRCFWKA